MVFFLAVRGSVARRPGACGRRPASGALLQAFCEHSRLFKRKTHQFTIEQGTRVPKGSGSLLRGDDAGVGVNGQRLFQKMQRQGIRGNRVHFVSGWGGRWRRISEKKRTIWLLMRAKVAVQRMMQKRPPRVNQIPGGCEHGRRGSCSEKTRCLGTGTR